MCKRDYEYIISGITKDGEDRDYCLAVVLPNGISKEKADEILKQMLEKPTESDKRMLEDFDLSTLIVKKIESWQCWWNDPVMCR